MADSIDHTFTEEIVCPQCGYEFSDSWEHGHGSNSDDGREECDECGCEFFWSREIEVTYSTSFIQREPTRETQRRERDRLRFLEITQQRGAAR